MIRVAYLLGSLERGGTETLLLDTLREAAKIKIPCLLIHRKPGELLADFKQTGIPIYQQSIRSTLDVGYLLRLRKQLLQNRIQVVHAQLPLDGFLAYWACLGTGIKLVLSIHGYDIGYRKLVRYMLSFIIRRTDLTLFVSQAVKQHYVAVYALSKSEQRMQVVYNGVDFNKFDQPIQSSFRFELSIPSDTLLLGSVGNFVTGRDHLTTCRFLGELKKRDIYFLFAFVGARSASTPDLYDSCVDYCAEHGLTEQVHFLGSRPDVPAILHQLDAFVYASDHDTFGIGVVEAMAAGVPVFVNDWAVMREITQEGRWATLYKSKDVNDLVQKFSHFLQTRSLCRQQANQNAGLVRQAYSISKHVQTLHHHYQALL